jgi:hypothetical protein
MNKKNGKWNELSLGTAIKIKIAVLNCSETQVIFENLSKNRVNQIFLNTELPEEVKTQLIVDFVKLNLSA